MPCLCLHSLQLQLTGAGMNPARCLGPAMVMNSWKDHWVLALFQGPAIDVTIALLGYVNYTSTYNYS